MCCRDFKACVIAAIWGIIQSSLHLGFCIWGVFMYECKYQLDTNTFQYFWYLTYFYTNTCMNATFDNVGIPTTAVDYVLISPNYGNRSMQVHDGPTHVQDGFTHAHDVPPLQYKQGIDAIVRSEKPQIIFPPRSAVASRTVNIFSTYLIVDILWIITAFGLLVGTVCRIRQVWSSFLFFPWCGMLLFVLFFDAVATVWYGTDIPQTHGITNWFLFIGAKNQSSFVQLEAKYPKSASILPSVMMALLFSRFILIWLVNLFLFFRIVQASINAYEDFDDSESIGSKHLNQGHLGEVNIVNNHRPRNFQVTEVNPISATARIRRWRLYYGSDDEKEHEEEVIRRYPRRHSKQKQGRHRKDSDFQLDNSTKNEQNLAVIGGYEGDRSSSPSPLPECSKHFYSSGYEFNDLYGSVNNRETPVPSASPDYEEIYYNNRKQDPTCIGELRGQLPWSYFQDRNDLTIPKVRIRDDVMPPVPVPDYSVKFNNKDKNRTKTF